LSRSRFSRLWRGRGGLTSRITALGFNLKEGGHRHGRVLRHVHDDFNVLLPAAIQQGVALYDVVKKMMRD
jgi:hypothetical protein